LMGSFCLVLFLDGYFVYSTCKVIGFGWLPTVNKCYELLWSLIKNY